MRFFCLICLSSFKNWTRYVLILDRAVASSIIGGGGGGWVHIHIFVFTDHKNNRFEKKLIVQNMNIWIWAPPPASSWRRPWFWLNIPKTNMARKSCKEIYIILKVFLSETTYLDFHFPVNDFVHWHCGRVSILFSRYRTPKSYCGQLLFRRYIHGNAPNMPFYVILAFQTEHRLSSKFGLVNCDQIRRLTVQSIDLL